jgi:predicted regulator of Ras-like GTPase activity (Roadblock/LC7/MglB family)
MFRELLTEVVSGVDGALGAILMGSDGLPVEQVAAGAAGEAADIETIAMELSVLVREVRKVTGQLNAGEAEELMIRGAGLTALVRVVTAEYFVALALRPEASVGKGRFLLRRAAPKLREQL